MKRLLVFIAVCCLFADFALAQEDSIAVSRIKSDVLCEDTCSHIHGIDLSHSQGSVFWETIGDNTKMTYVYLKATEGGDRIDAQFERNIELAHRYGLKVGS